MTTTDKVRQMLQDNPRLRDSDQWLIFAFWQAEGLVLTDTQKMQLTNLTTAESITRVRRKLREEYPGSEAVEKERFKKMEEYTDEYSGRPAIRFR